MNGICGRATLSKVETGLTHKQVKGALAVLMILIFSKFFYLSSLTSYLTFYLIHHFGVSIQNSQYCLFVFLFGVALGSLADMTSIEFVYQAGQRLPPLAVRGGLPAAQ